MGPTFERCALADRVLILCMQSDIVPDVGLQASVLLGRALHRRADGRRQPCDRWCVGLCVLVFGFFKIWFLLPAAAVWVVAGSLQPSGF